MCIRVSVVSDSSIRSWTKNITAATPMISEGTTSVAPCSPAAAPRRRKRVRVMPIADIVPITMQKAATIRATTTECSIEERAPGSSIAALYQWVVKASKGSEMIVELLKEKIASRISGPKRSSITKAMIATLAPFEARAEARLDMAHPLITPW